MVEGIPYQLSLPLPPPPPPPPKLNLSVNIHTFFGEHTFSVGTEDAVT